MKIAYFNANLKKGQDGVTRVMYKMFEGVIKNNHQAIAISATLPDVEDRIIPMYAVSSIVSPFQKSYRLALPSYHLFSHHLRSFKPDIIHINSPCTLGYAAIKYAKKHNVPVVATYHTHFPTYARYYKMKHFEQFSWKIIKYFYNRVERTFVPSIPIMQELIEHKINNLEYLPNGVDVDIFNPKHRSNSWRAQISKYDKPILLFISRLVWEKDLRVLVDAYNILRRMRDDFELVIVGDGPARTEFAQMMPGAHFLGYQSGSNLSKIFASSDIFVFPSTTETFGLVTLEAMASGLAPVAAKVGGAVEIIEEGKSGLFTKPLNGEDIAQKIIILLDDEQLRKNIASAAHDRAQKYRWERIIEKLLLSYSEITEKFTRARCKAK